MSSGPPERRWLSDWAFETPARPRLEMELEEDRPLVDRKSCACPWTAEQVQAAKENPEHWITLLFEPGDYRRAQVLMPELVGLELPDRNDFESYNWPPPPSLPEGAPQGPWPWWAPAWLELPMPGRPNTPDFWHWGQKQRTPPIWAVPEWDGDDRNQDVDPRACVLIWYDIESGITRCPWVVGSSC